LGQCCVLLNSIILQEDVNERWLWNLHASKKYNVGSVYNFLIPTDQHIIDENTHLSWHKEVPMKVCLFM